ncbi:MAG TPA: Gp138 family membrane-puncturing spike protein [Bacillota bacterium]|nr:Gp138 family membrane-puncturing spike protein [Bacillota bacterium]
MEPKDFIKALIDQYLTELHVALPARIESYDPKTLRATVTVLAKKTLEGKPVTIPPIVEVPVMILKSGPFIIRPPYVPGDIVQVLFNERALDNIFITGEPQEVGLNRMHSLDDAVVIGGMRVENANNLPEEYSDSLYLANVDANAKVVIKPNGDVIINGGQIFLGEGATEGVSLGTSLKGWLDGHTHPYSWTDPGGSSNTGAPNSASPDPSSIVKVK